MGNGNAFDIPREARWPQTSTPAGNGEFRKPRYAREVTAIRNRLFDESNEDAEFVAVAKTELDSQKKDMADFAMQVPDGTLKLYEII